jgi:Carboxypeptidase regulatory-like domain
MRSLPLIVLIPALLLAVGSNARALAQEQEQRQSNDPSLWIEVRDERGAPLKDACVTVVPREGEILFRKADARGRVRIKRLTRGRYRVTAKVDGYAAQKKEVEMGAGGTQGETVSFSLQPRSGQR